MGKNNLKSKDIKNYLSSSKKDSEENKKLEIALQESEKKFKQFSDNIGAGMFIKNSKGERIFANNYLKDILEFKDEAFFEDNSYENKLPMFNSYDEEVLQNKIVSYENKIYDDDKREVRVLWTTKFPIKSNEHGLLIGGTCIDVTEIKQSEKKIRDLSYKHRSVKIYNLKFLEMKIKEFIKEEEGTQYAIVHIIIKNIDEVYEIGGQAKLNRVLEIVDSIIKKHASEKSVNILLNDREFVLGIFDYSNTDTVLHLCKQIENTFINPIYIDDIELSVILNMGIAVYPKHGESLDSLIQKLRIYMKSEYLSQKNILLYNSNIESNIRLKKDLNKAIENNELVLYYQPIIDANSEKIIKVEALLRWIHPEKGLISPVIFIPLAEESNQILNLGQWVIKQGVSQLKSWNDKGIEGITMSINISPKQFQQKSFVEIVKKIIKDTKVNPKNLEFEITESIAINDLNLTLSIISELSKWGIKWAMDDFGTGYSSLTKLKDLKLDTLKIDRAFVSEINENLDTALMVSAIIAMAKNLKMNIVAEGVENLEQFEFLKNKNCDMLQGFLISKPCEAKVIEKLFFKEFSFHKKFLECIKETDIEEYYKYIKNKSWESDLCDNGNKGYMVLDNKGKIIETNRILLQMLGYNWKEFKSRHLLTLLSQKYKGLYQKALAIIHEEVPFCVELIKKDKSVAYVEIAYKICKDNNGNIVKVICLVKDLNEIYSANREIIEKKEAYKRIFYNAPLGFIKWNKDMIIQDWNKYAEKIFGWTKIEAIGKNILRLLTDKSSEKEMLDLVQRTLYGLNVNSINKNITKYNDMVQCEWHSECIYDIDGTLAFVISIIKDIDSKEEKVII